MRVDVIIPVHDGEATVRRALDSVWAQTGDAELSVLAIDDSSTDGSLDLLRELAAADDRLTVLANPRNLGVAATRNLGIAAGDAPVVAFLDQDDEWMPDKLRLQLAVLAERPDVGYVVGRQLMVLDEPGRLPGWARREWLDAPQLGYLPSSLVARRATFERIGAFDESFRAGGDDTDWFARARRAGVPSVHLDDTLVRRHLHGSNLSSDRRTDREILALVRRHVTDLRGGA